MKRGFVILALLFVCSVYSLPINCSSGTESVGEGNIDSIEETNSFRGNLKNKIT